jgi:RND family efflux transporter MFP subunit
MNYDRVLVDLKIPNAFISKISLGQTLRVENYAFPDRTFAGVISAVDPALDPNTRTFRVVGNVNNPDLLLRPGMFVKAEIVTESREDVVVIPRRYVLTRQNSKVVFVEEEGRAQMRNVTTGLEDREHVEITEGIEAGERLITSNYETLRARTKVRVTGEGVPGAN